MDRLNYHHLYYFWRIQQDGGIAKAAARLRLSHSTLSVQLAALEAMLGAALFERKGRRLSLTPLGVEISAYAGEIFRLGTELVEVAGGQRGGRRSAFRIGVVHSLPKTFTLRILRPVAPARRSHRARRE
jgi:LysR family transcriptional regulator, transcriptional activator of nhaA